MCASISIYKPISTIHSHEWEGFLNTLNVTIISTYINLEFRLAKDIHSQWDWFISSKRRRGCREQCGEGGGGGWKTGWRWEGSEVDYSWIYTIFCLSIDSHPHPKPSSKISNKDRHCHHHQSRSYDEVSQPPTLPPPSTCPFKNSKAINSFSWLMLSITSFLAAYNIMPLIPKSWWYQINSVSI